MSLSPNKMAMKAPVVHPPRPDVIFNVKGSLFQAHVAVLQLICPVFASKLLQDIENKGTVNIIDCEPDNFAQFLEFVYKGNPQIDGTKSAIALYDMAKKYDFQKLKQACVRWLANSLDEQVDRNVSRTMCKLFMMAADNLEHDLLREAYRFFGKNIETVLVTDEWYEFLKAYPEQSKLILKQAVDNRVEERLLEMMEERNSMDMVEELNRMEMVD